MSHENFQTSWNLRFPPLEPETSSLFGLIVDTSVDIVFHFKIRLLFSSLLNRTIDLDIKVLNQVLLTLASDHGKQKSKTLKHNFWLKINLLN
jgi:hypothetical protein